MTRREVRGPKVTTGRKKFEESFLVVHSSGPKISPQVVSTYKLRIETCSRRTSAYARREKGSRNHACYSEIHVWLSNR